MAMIGAMVNTIKADTRPLEMALKRARLLMAMTRKEILKTMKETGGSVLIQGRGKAPAHYAHPGAVPEDDVLARGDPTAEQRTAEEMEVQARELLDRARALRTPVQNPTPVLDTDKPPVESVPQGEVRRETTQEANRSAESRETQPAQAAEESQGTQSRRRFK
jgi:hypothetical protein